MLDQVIIDGEAYGYDATKCENYEFHFTSTGESVIAVRSFGELDS
jgi:hypothetical protein